MFDTVLVANRGEIAVRVIRTLARLGIRSVAVYSDADEDAPHARAADVAVRIGAEPPAASYLSAERLVAAARRTGAQAVHPGYGFLSENAGFARACAEAGLVFVGPPADALEAMGDKTRAKALAEAAGVPVVPGVHRPGMDDAALIAAAGDVGYPLLVKAAAGGGGRGMRVVAGPGELAEGLAAARREALGAFGDDALLLERYLRRARHVEVQVFADAHGGVVHLGERECSLQRRHQKIIEECPSPLTDEDLRNRMAAHAVAVAQACGYVGAGTVEFLVDAGALHYFFLEMNTRLQVEHPVTEMVYGVDLVAWQLQVAAGHPLPVTQEQLRPRGHAIEARVNAEDPARGFLPTGGTVLGWWEPPAEDVRTDRGVDAGASVGSAYDPLLGKVIAWGPDRGSALRRLRRHLDASAILGVVTNASFLTALLAHPDVEAGRLDTLLVERAVDELVSATVVPETVLAAAGLAKLAELGAVGPTVDAFDLVGGWRVGERAWARWRVRAGGRIADVATRGGPGAAEVRVDDGPVLPARVRRDGHVLVTEVAGEQVVFTAAFGDGVVWLAAPGLGTWALAEEHELAAARHAAAAAAGGPLVAPMPGTVAAVHVAPGDAVRVGQTLVVVEAMKMEHPVTAPVDGTVTAIAVRLGERVHLEQVLAVVEQTGGTA
ncbi:MAG TPA: biotin carboxylase N-terminal domain-containing protein [Egibacteraceae bacterium]|nr:biotin carboxylase N-terminal domain-containing protein [Egibacteraceae bacterium]